MALVKCTCSHGFSHYCCGHSIKVFKEGKEYLFRQSGEHYNMLDSVGIYMGVLYKDIFSKYFIVEDDILNDIDKIFNNIMDEKL